MASEMYCLRWNDFESNIATAFCELRDNKDFFDVTLACEDGQIQAHKVILSACSPFFRTVLRRNPHQHPLIYLKGVSFRDLKFVLNFMYHGEVNVAQEELNSFLALAEELKVKGLSKDADEPSKAPNDLNSSNEMIMMKPEVILEEVNQNYVSDTGGDNKLEEGGVKPKVIDKNSSEEDRQIVEDRTIVEDNIVKEVEGWKCKVCGRKGKKSHILDHIESAHFAHLFKYECSVCGKNSKTKSALRTHMNTHHRDFHNC